MIREEEKHASVYVTLVATRTEKKKMAVINIPWASVICACMYIYIYMYIKRIKKTL